MLRVDVEPWETLSVDSGVTGTEASMIGVIADRRCRGRRGIHFFGSERVSWYIFQTGGLVSYDHFEFGEACEPRNHYLPSRIELLATEQALVRYAASRYPGSAPTTEEMLSKGLALVAADRLPDAKRMLRNADREIEVMVAKSPERAPGGKRSSRRGGDATAGDAGEALQSDRRRPARRTLRTDEPPHGSGR